MAAHCTDGLDLHSQLSESAGNLSVGQKQLLCLARQNEKNILLDLTVVAAVIMVVVVVLVEVAVDLVVVFAFGYHKTA